MQRAIGRNLLLCACVLLAGRVVYGQTVAWKQAIETSERIQAAGKLREAKQVLLEILQGGASPGAHDLAYIYNNLGSICQDEARYLDADRYYRRSVTEWKRSADPYRLALARTLNNWASLLWETGKQGEAERALALSLSIHVEVLGPQHPETALQFYNVGLTRLGRRRWAAAALVYRQYLAVHNESPGERLETAVAANNLAFLYSKGGRGAEADLLLKQARLIWERFPNANDASPVLLLDVAASFWRNHQAEAEPAVVQALAALESRFGAQHSRVAQALTLYADILRRTHRKTQARAILNWARSIRTDDEQLRLFRQTINVNSLTSELKSAGPVR